MPSAVPLIPWQPVDWTPAIRLTAREYSVPTVFDLVTDDGNDAVIAGLVADLTNPTSAAGAARYLSLSSEERIKGPGAGLILGPFCFGTAPTRFSNGQRGVWYGASTVQTAVAERAHHTAIALRDSNSPATVLQMAVVHTALNGHLADIRGRKDEFASVYSASSYDASQSFAEEQYRRGAYGIVYESIRDLEGQCAAVFRPGILRDASVARFAEWMWDGSSLKTSE